jgi:hypothetical protein
LSIFFIAVSNPTPPNPQISQNKFKTSGCSLLCLPFNFLLTDLNLFTSCIKYFQNIYHFQKLSFYFFNVWCWSCPMFHAQRSTIYINLNNILIIITIVTMITMIAMITMITIITTVT